MLQYVMIRVRYESIRRNEIKLKILIYRTPFKVGKQRKKWQHEKRIL